VPTVNSSSRTLPESKGEDFTIRKEILLEFPDETDNRDITRQEIALIREYGSNDPSRGYNRHPKFKERSPKIIKEEKIYDIL